MYSLISQTAPQCEGGSIHHPFGRGLQAMSSTDGVSHSSIIQLPISSVTNDANDIGAPICLTRPDDARDILAAFEQLGEVVSKELLQLRYSEPDSSGVVAIDGVQFEVESLNCSIEKDKESFSVRLYSETGATKVRVSAGDIRGRDPKTGELLSVSSPEIENKEVISSPDDSMVTVHKVQRAPRKDISTIPRIIEKKGRYGFAVEWEDGATII